MEEEMGWGPPKEQRSLQVQLVLIYEVHPLTYMMCQELLATGFDQQ